MKFSGAALLALPVLAWGSPVAVPEPVHELAKRSYTCATTESDVRYHTKPYVSAPAPGQYGAAGTKVALVCWLSGGEYGPSDTYGNPQFGTYPAVG